MYSPLERLALPGLGDIECSGLTLIVGPNSSGKSQLLRDMAMRLVGDPRELVVAEEIELKQLPYDELVGALKDGGFITQFEDDAGNSFLRPLTTYGGGGAAQQMQVNQVQSWYNTSRRATPSAKRRDEYLGYLGRFLVTALFLENRLTALNQAGMIDFIGQAPQNDLQALHMNDEAKEELFQEVRASFGKAVWPDISRGTGVCLRVSDEGSIPSDKERLSAKKMAAFRTIETEGDGLKSYVATCVALLLGRRPVCIVDEPELCLHPPQAYNLGRFIGRFGSSLEGKTFVATHSSNILRGMIQTAPKLRIIRLTRREGRFRAHSVSADVLQSVLLKPTVRAESVLDGVFAQAVVIVEADGDRTVYQAVWETLERESRLDVHFTTAGGAGGIADTAGLYRTLRIPVGVIADLDVIADRERIHRMLKALGCAEADAIATECHRISEAVRLMPPTISEGEIRVALEEIAGTELAWAMGDDAKIRRRLRELAQRLDRMRRLKVPTVEPLPAGLKNEVDALLEKLAASGLFVVPVGELENWLASLGIEASRANKWAWANEAAAKIRECGRRDGDVWTFIDHVGNYLDAQFVRLDQDPELPPRASSS